MNFEDLCERFETLDFPSADEKSHPDEAIVRAARADVTDAVNSDDFLTECLGNELILIKSNIFRQGLVPFSTLPRLGIGFAFGYWPPGGSPGPHEHTAWTITAVCRNELEVSTFDRNETLRQGQLIPKNRFRAQSGMVGFIHSPCIHAPKNISHDWSLSFHVISPLDGEPLNDRTTEIFGLNPLHPLPLEHTQHPYRNVRLARQQSRHLHQVGNTLSTISTPKAHKLLVDCYKFSTTSSQRDLKVKSPHILDNEELCPLSVLERIHPKLILDFNHRNGTVNLGAYSASGFEKEFSVSDFALGAIEFITEKASFDVRELPGTLKDEERQRIGEILEDRGLYKRVRH